MKNGVVILDKPSDFTSFDAAACLRRIFNTKKIGHTGTLDPMATGVLVMLIGSAAKALPFLTDTDKEYEAGFALGIKTDTEDITGTIKEKSDKRVTKDELIKVLPLFRGDIMQTPPMYSAVSQNGVRLYNLARQGIEVEREARKIHIEKLELADFDEEKQTGKLLVSCSKGTYIRTLCADIGKKAGSLAVMSDLRRTRACGFSIDQSVALDKLKRLKEENRQESVILPIDTLFTSLPSANITPAQELRFKNGGYLDMNRVTLKDAVSHGQTLKLYGNDGFVGLGSIDRENNRVNVLKAFLNE